MSLLWEAKKLLVGRHFLIRALKAVLIHDNHKWKTEAKDQNKTERGDNWRDKRRHTDHCHPADGELRGNLENTWGSYQPILFRLQDRPSVTNGKEDAGKHISVAAWHCWKQNQDPSSHFKPFFLFIPWKYSFIATPGCFSFILILHFSSLSFLFLYTLCCKGVKKG